MLGPLPAEKARNAEAVAVFATLAPRRHRATVVRTIVALQVAIDLRDELEERAELSDPSGRLKRLQADWQRELAALPSASILLPSIERAVERCAEGQRRTHAAGGGDSAELERWAAALDPSSGYRWWELAAGASSSVAAHALIAAAADPGASAEEAAEIDAAYFPSIGALTVFLDDLVDSEADREAGEHSYLSYYASSEEAAARLAWIAEQARGRIGSLPHPCRQRAILAGVGAYYLSDPAAATPSAQPIRRRLLAALGPGTRALATFVWTRRLLAGKRPEQAGSSPEP